MELGVQSLIPVAIATPSSQTICTGGTTSIALSSDIPGTTFSWTVVQSGVTGASAGSGSSIAQTLTTTTNAVGTATYTVTPALECTGTPITVVVTVIPTSVATATPSSQTICSGETTSIALSSDVPNTTFSWTVVENGVDGAFDGSGSSINQTLTTTSDATGTATYTITPSADGCIGNPINVVVTVNSCIPLPPTHFVGVVKTNKFLNKTQYLLKAKWDPSPSKDIIRYLILEDGVPVKSVPQPLD